jgi:hypothetical protein
MTGKAPLGGQADVLWTLIGTSAAWLLGVWEDLGLLAAGIIGTGGVASEPIICLSKPIGTAASTGSYSIRGNEQTARKSAVGRFSAAVQANRALTAEATNWSSLAERHQGRLHPAASLSSLTADRLSLSHRLLPLAEWHDAQFGPWRVV